MEGEQSAGLRRAALITLGPGRPHLFPTSIAGPHHTAVAGDIVSPSYLLPHPSVRQIDQRKMQEDQLLALSISLALA
jgi:hypothetical protein